jgi:hypothetical protein
MYVTRLQDNAYVTAGPCARLLTSVLLRADFNKSEGYDNLDVAYCLDAPPLIAAGSTECGVVIGSSCNLRS